MKLVYRLALGAWCVGLCAGAFAQFDYNESTANVSLAPVAGASCGPCSGAPADAHAMGVEAGSAVGNVAAGGVIFYAGAKVAAPVYEAAVEATSIGRISGMGTPGAAMASVPVIGSSAAAVGIPTTLGDLPLIGGVIQDIPVVGGTIAGPPPPWLTAAVAVDTYILPKYYPMGCTPRAVFTQTDFNSPPRLLHYKNYLPPMPYTHPPVAPPAEMPFAIAATENDTLSQLRVGTLNLEY